jgi:hypothetical protein
MDAARLHFIKQENSVRKAWLRARKKASKVRETNLGGAGMNKILRPEQHQAMIRYAVDQATNKGRGPLSRCYLNALCGFAFKRIRQFFYKDSFKLSLKTLPNFIRSRPSRLRVTVLIYIPRTTFATSLRRNISRRSSSQGLSIGNIHTTWTRRVAVLPVPQEKKWSCR